MSGSDLVLFTQPRGAELDWGWLEGWLSDGLGVRVRVIATADIRDHDVSMETPCFLYGDRDSWRIHRDLPIVEAAPDDLLVSACRLPRGIARARGVCASEAVIDRALTRLGQALDARYPALTRQPRWPSPYRWALVLTHDVDSVDRWTAEHIRHLGRHIGAGFRREGIRAVARLPWASIRGFWERPAIGRRLRACLDLERRNDVCATYLFFAPCARHRGALDAWYTPETPLEPGGTVGEFWEYLARGGFEIGLHLSIGAHARPDAIRAEWTSLHARVSSLVTYRSHHLADAPGITLPTLISVGARVDLNLVADGFAWGSGLPWRLPSPSGDVFRLPAVIEDGALEVDGASAEVREGFWRRCRPILEEAERNESVATVLLHPENPGAVETAGRLIGWARERGAWITSAAELVRHWRERTPRPSPVLTSDAARH